MSNLDFKTISQQILVQAPDAILYADRKGHIQMWNKGAERIFGFTADQVIGESLDLIIPEKLQARHWEGYHKTMATGETRYGTELLAVPAMHRDGSRLSVEFSIVMLLDAGNKPEGIAAIMRDVTEHHRKEKELRQRLEKLETAQNG